MANDCGCTSSNDSNCYSQTNAVQQMLLPITANDCYGQSGAASNCPTYFEPATLTAENVIFTVPAVGATTNLPLLCNANKFRVGMWIENPAYGKYPIVGVNVATNLLTLQNSCSDGVTAIPGNPEPGTQIGGQQSIWVSGADPCRDAAAFCADTITCLQSITDDNPLCTEDFPETASGECGYPLILTAACDSGDCPQPDDPNCWKRMSGVRICNDKIIFDDGMEVAEDDQCGRPIVITEEGETLEAPAGAGLIKPTKAYLGVWATPGVTNGAGIVAAMNFTIDMSNFGVPDCAVGCIIRPIYRYDYDTSSGDGPAFTTFLRGTGQPSNNVAYAISFVSAIAGSTIQDRPVSDALGGISVVFGPDKIVYHECENNGTQGSGNFVQVRLYLDAIII